MKDLIEVTITTSSFLTLEELKEFCEDHDDCEFSWNKSAKKARQIKNVGRRKRITKIELAAIVLSIKQNPDWNDPTIAKSTGVSAATVGRIRDGSHTLQRH